MIPWSYPSSSLPAGIMPRPSSDAKITPRAAKDVSLHVLLHFLARRLAHALPEQGSPLFLGLFLHRLILSSRHPPLVHARHQMAPIVLLHDPPRRRHSRASTRPQRGPASEELDTSIASAGLFTHKSSIQTPRSRRRFAICPVITKALSWPKET